MVLAYSDQYRNTCTFARDIIWTTEMISLPSAGNSVHRDTNLGYMDRLYKRTTFSAQPHLE